jgi:hypothetical protein
MGTKKICLNVYETEREREKERGRERVVKLACSSAPKGKNSVLEREKEAMMIIMANAVNR